MMGGCMQEAEDWALTVAVTGSLPSDLSPSCH